MVGQQLASTKNTSKAMFHKGGLFELSVYSMHMSLYWYPYVWTNSSLHLFHLQLEALKQSHGTTSQCAVPFLFLFPYPISLNFKKHFLLNILQRLYRI